MFRGGLLLIIRRYYSVYIKGKNKAVPLQAWGGPEGFRNLRFPDFITTAQDDGKVVSTTHRPPLPPGNAPVLVSVRGRVDSRAIVRTEGFYMTTAGIESATFRFVVQDLTTALPRSPLCICSKWYMSCAYVDWLLAGSWSIIRVYRTVPPDDEQ